MHRQLVEASSPIASHGPRSASNILTDITPIHLSTGHTSTQRQVKTLVIIDATVDAPHQLIADVSGSSDVRVSLLSPDQNGVLQVTRLLHEHSAVKTVHLISHGSPGCLKLGDTELSLSTLSQYTTELQGWFPSPSQVSLMVYGCRVARGDAGTEFLQALRSLTGANIAASSTLTGARHQGGDWDLTAHAGHPTATPIFSQALQQSYPGILAIPVNTLLLNALDAPDSTLTGINGFGGSGTEFPANEQYTVNFGTGQDLLLTGFEANIGGGGTQQFTPELGGVTLSSNIAIQRSGAAFNTPFFALDGLPQNNQINILGSGAATDEAALNGNIINRGIEAVFLNEGQAASNIERLDYVFPSSLQTTDATELDSIGFLVVERGGNDSFKIAPILALDANNAPAQYGNLVTVQRNEFGTTNQQILAVQFSQGVGDTTIRPDNIFRPNGQPQSIGATYISWADLGLTASTEVFGYSLFAPDTNPVAGSLLDVTSGAFPDDTANGAVDPQNPNNTRTGSIDLVAGGFLFRGTTVDDLVQTNQGPDTDRDGIPDVIDVDDDNDGIPDALEGDRTRDTDGDGRPDSLDLDADNDGIPDNIEAQTTAGYRPPSGVDADGDGLDDAYDPDQGGTPIIPVNTDGTDNVDYLDADSDNDGIPDVAENNEAANAPLGTDADQDGIDDAFDDVDNTVIWDINDDINVPSGDLPNSNGTGDVDYREASGTPTPPPTPGDSDGDGILDVDDLDDDNDGILDTVEDRGVPNRDTDGDGVPDRLDLDADNDGILDVVEANHGQPDANGDGRIDGPVGPNGYLDALETTPESGVPNYTPVDTDGDGLPDFQDLDADNDSIPDVIEGGGSDPDRDGIIGSGTPVVNASGIANDINPAVGGTPVSTPNTDGDALPDYRDLDSDNDGVNDVVERGGEFSGGFVDTDGDGVVDGVDTDQDGIVDIVDGNVGTFGTAPDANTPVLDSNDNGIPDFQDQPDTLTTVLGDTIGDALLGFSDNDQLTGGDGNDIISGGSNADRLNGGGGDDVINGGSNADIINGGSGDDVINGGTGDDLLRGNSGNDIILGGNGRDRIVGGAGRDEISGGGGRDRLLGKGGRDTINGDRGNDVINGGRGRDTVSGGQGRDTFVISSIRDIGDRVKDFELVKDRMNLRRLNSGVNSFSDLDIAQSGEDALISTQGGQLIARFEGIEASDLNSTHFLF